MGRLYVVQFETADGWSKPDFYVGVTSIADAVLPPPRGRVEWYASFPSIEDAEEERRLFYVALTRAKEKVYLTHAQSRMVFGSRNIAVPSEFLYDVPEELIELHADIPRSLPSIFFD